jgi:hypothetical protein
MCSWCTELVLLVLLRALCMVKVGTVLLGLLFHLRWFHLRWLLPLLLQWLHEADGLHLSDSVGTQHGLS